MDYMFSTNEAYDIPSEYYNIDRFHISSRSNSKGFYVRSLTIWNRVLLDTEIIDLYNIGPAMILIIGFNGPISPPTISYEMIVDDYGLSFTDLLILSLLNLWLPQIGNGIRNPIQSLLNNEVFNCYVGEIR